MLLNISSAYAYSNYTPRIDGIDPSISGTTPVLTDYTKINWESDGIRTINEIFLDTDNNINPDELIKNIFLDLNDTIGFVTSCPNGCDGVSGNFYAGMPCPTCGTIITTYDPSVLKFKAQFKIPENYPPILHPAAFKVFNKWLGKGEKKQLLESFFINKYFPKEFRDLGWKPGLSFFYENFDMIIEYLLTTCKMTRSGDRKKRGTDILEFINKYRDQIFVRNLPILNQTLHIITKFGGGKKLSDSQVGLVMKIYSLFNTMRLSVLSGRRQNSDSRLHQIAMTYYQYTDEILKKKGSGKKGFPLQNIVAGRLHNSFRTVIVPITELHDMDELHIPWKVGVEILELEILNLLQNRFGYSNGDAIALHYRAKNNYIREVHECILSLIKECPYKGLPVLWNRNPSLNQGSIQLLFISKVKTDINDKTTGMSQAIISAFNADLTRLLLIIIIQGPLTSNRY